MAKEWGEGGVVRAVYFSMGGKIIFARTKMGFNVLGIRKQKSTGNDSKSNFIAAQNIVFINKTNKKKKKRKKFQNAIVIEQGSNKRSEVNREGEIPGPPLNLRSFT